MIEPAESSPSNNNNNNHFFENIDFSLKGVDSLDFLSQVGTVQKLPLIQNPSLFNSCHNEFDPFFPNLSEQGSFCLGPINSQGLRWTNQDDFSLLPREEDFDFMNFYQQEDVSSKNNNNNNFLNNQSNQFLFENELLQRYTEQSSCDILPFEAAAAAVAATKNSIIPLINIQGYNNKKQEQEEEIEDQKKEAQLLKISDFDRMLPEMEFEPFSEEEQRQMKEYHEKCQAEGKVPLPYSERYGSGFLKIVSKIADKKKHRNYDKNICRYIARQMMRSFMSNEFKDIALTRFCHNNTILFENTLQFVSEGISAVSGHRTFRDLLVQNDTDSQSVQESKSVLKSFSKWFLRERSLRFIILGNSEKKTQYIRYKNQVMLHFIDKPQDWNANFKIKAQPFRVRKPIQKQHYQETGTTSSSCNQERY